MQSDPAPVIVDPPAAVIRLGIKCPACGSTAARTKSTDRLSGAISRRRYCGDCGKRFQTVEKIVIK